MAGLATLGKAHGRRSPKHDDLTLIRVQRSCMPYHLCSVEIAALDTALMDGVS